MTVNWRVNIREVIGTGSFSTVYPAASLQDPGGSYVAKVANRNTRSDSKASKKALKAFEKECEILASLSHPHISQLLEEGLVERRIMYIMPAYGTPLYYLICAGRFQAISQVTKLAAELFDALAYIHQKGVIHGDVSSMNIYWPSEKVILADFGSCQYVEEKKKQQYLVTSDSRPPEIFMLAEEYGTEVDVWSAAQVVISVLLKRIGPFSFPRAEEDFSKTQIQRALRQFISYIGSAPPTSMQNYQTYFDTEGALREEIPLELALVTRERVQREIDFNWKGDQRVSEQISRIIQGCLVWVDRPSAAHVGKSLREI